MATPFVPKLSLHPSQEQATAHIRRKAISLRPTILPTINQILEMAKWEASLPQPSPPQYHPSPRSTTVSSSLLDSGIYKSQFETGISAGSVTAYPGGARDEWERTLFSSAYQSPTVSPSHRPKYGALDIMRNDDGPAPRFGSCIFILKPDVAKRSTFTFGGSEAGPKYVGTSDEFQAILAALLEEAFVRDFCLGVHDIRPWGFLKRISELENEMGNGGGYGAESKFGSFYRGAGSWDIFLGRDVEALFVDSSFKGSETGRDLEAMAEKYGFELRRRKGFSMRVEDVPMDFRGATMPSLAKMVARDGVVDTAGIGSGVRNLAKVTEGWCDRATYAEVLLELKLLWHVLVRFGSA